MPHARHIKIDKQVSLPLSKAAGIALKSLTVRLTRSILTLVTIVMAIAFLTYVWAGAACEPAIRRAASAAGVTLLSSAGSGQTTERTVWLLTLSLLVCTVGISNAMLMSVIERFREIGTMKCLGALDSFILKLFLLEALFLGVLGSILGVALGGSLAVALQLSALGAPAWRFMPWNTLGLVAFASGGIGLGITVLASLYPALRAARMEPVAAMRVDV